MKVTISIDDVNPKSGWQILGTPVEKWLCSLNEEFGAKFTLFVPSCYHAEFPLSKNKKWVQELASIEFLELAAHGHFHMTSDPKKFGECEFMEIDKYQPFLKRVYQMYDEWAQVGCIPIGWKSPGWLCSNVSCKLLNSGLSAIEEDDTKLIWKPLYISLHTEHNRGLKWDCKTFFGHDGIDQTNISICNDDMIMLTSHIAGDWNDNVWNERNYKQLRLSLSHLVENYDCDFKTLKECI